MARVKKLQPEEYRFKIDAYTRETLPMSRLAEYLDELAKVFGEDHSVHFSHLEDGSVVPVVRVDYEAVPKVKHQLRLVKLKEAPKKVMDASARINKLLREDNTSGYIAAPDEKKVVVFPGIKRDTSPAFGPFTESGTLEGVPIMIGGEQDWVPIHLEGHKKETLICVAKRSVAKEMASYLFTVPVRVEGKARWLRNEDNEWELVSFRVHGFTALKTSTLADDIKTLRKVPGKWKELDDPLGELNNIRHDVDIEYVDTQ